MSLMAEENDFLPLTGFPSPAETHWEPPLDLNHQLIAHPAASFVVRARRAWPRLGVCAGDLLLVDRALEPRSQQVVLGVLDGAFCLGRLRLGQHGLALDAGPGPLQELLIWGVVTCVMRRLV
ncbi:MAG: hypothetical protein CVV27_01100 [Candidatus Melainabacteria bacterium HGW-Melainabacteria-1]|nr:MAG: hypothetical protein CVV27_01100 [Candidatus Melainabacteria bacterium HGW-Melainabacteria-1]